MYGKQKQFIADREKKKKWGWNLSKGIYCLNIASIASTLRVWSRSLLNGWLLGFLPGKFCLFAGGNPALCCMVRGNCEKALRGCEVAAYWLDLSVDEARWASLEAAPLSCSVVVACCVRCCYAILCCAVRITHLPLPSLFFSSEDDTRVLSSSFSEERTSAFLNSKTRSCRGTTSLFCWMGWGKYV